MVNPDFELERLRMALRAKGLSDQDVNALCARAGREISGAITDALADAVQKAIEAGQQKEADDFIQELRAVATGSDYFVTTDSGTLDFSEPPFPMMARLLRNPKVAKDGSLYKVIPVGSKPRATAQNFSSITDVQKSINDARDSAKKSFNGGNPKDVSNAAMTFSGAFAAQKAAIRDNEVKRNAYTKNAGGANFKTVSSKQDPSKQWVQPAKDKDMTTDMADINSQLRDAIDQAIVDIVQRYEGA